MKEVFLFSIKNEGRIIPLTVFSTMQKAEDFGKHLRIVSYIITQMFVDTWTVVIEEAEG